MLIIIFLSVGLFLTDSADACKRAWFFCRKCHANIKSEKAVTKCGCKRTAVRMAEIKDFRSASRMQTKKRHNGADKVFIFRLLLIKNFKISICLQGGRKMMALYSIRIRAFF